MIQPPTVRGNSVISSGSFNILFLFGFKEKRTIKYHLKSGHLLFSKSLLTNTFLKAIQSYTGHYAQGL